MAQLIIFFWLVGFLVGYGFSYHINYPILIAQNKELKKRIRTLRLIWKRMSLPVPPRNKKGRVVHGQN